MLEKTSGTLRFDLLGVHRTEHWYLTITNGDVASSRSKDDADVLVTIYWLLLDQIVTGTANTVAASGFCGHLNVSFPASPTPNTGPRASREDYPKRTKA